MEKKVIRKVREEIARGFGSSINFLKIEQVIEEGLKEAKEEGEKKALKEVSDKIKEIYEASIPYGLYSPSEMCPLYERFTYAMQNYYIKMTSKLNDK